MSKKGRHGRSKKSSSNASTAKARSAPPSAHASEASETPADRRNDSSFPPVEFDHAFFAPAAPGDDPLGELEMGDPRLALKASPAAARRRAQLAKYVKGAVAVASALCLAAFVKVGVMHLQARAAAASPQLVTQVDPPAAPPQVTAAAADPPAAAAATVAAAATAPAPAAPTADGAAPATNGAAAASARDPKEAAKEKAGSRRALESGNVRQAIEAGELSVALDPTDGEAWLILGAAYQQKGDMKEARRCYKACLDQGKRGPKGECAAMLR